MIRHGVFLAAVLTAAVVVTVPGARWRRLDRRVGRQLRGGRAAAASHPGGVAELVLGPRRIDRVRWLAVLAGAASLLVIGWPGGLVGVGVAVAVDRGLRRLPPAEVRARQAAERADLPLVADLLAVALRAGAPVDRAAAAVGGSLPGPLGERLSRVSRVLALGGAPAEAWAELGPVPGAERLIRAAIRSADHGSALAGALHRLADDLRTDRATEVEAVSRRNGVLIVLPLGLCFLPAFILAGLVPVIVAVLGDVLSTEGI